MSRFKVGDKVVPIWNSHYNDKPQTVVTVTTKGVCLEEIRQSAYGGISYSYVMFYDEELEYWDIWKSPLWEALK